MSWTRNFIKISPDNDALKYLYGRIGYDSYRGSRSSQHNRYEMHHAFKILSILNDFTKNKKPMKIRTTDISKRPKPNPDELDYVRFCTQCKKETGIGTQDAMRKNLFPDFHRMGLIDRINKNGVKLDPFKIGSTKSVILTKLGLKFINSTINDRQYIYTRCIDELLEGRVGVALNILRNHDNIDEISFYEYMFFVSAINTGTEFELRIEEAIEKIETYRSLSRTERTAVSTELSVDLDPKNAKGPKTTKRDFHNWKNKIQQIFFLLQQTAYFDTDDVENPTKLMLKQNKKGNKYERTVKQIRSSSQKIKYFNEHNVKKIKGFQLHHVVPLEWSMDEHHFNLLDDWKNMVYIDGYNHARITSNRNRNVILTTDKQNIELSDVAKNSIYLEYKKNIAYDPKQQQVLLQYNKELRTEDKDVEYEDLPKYIQKTLAK